MVALFILSMDYLTISFSTSPKAWRNAPLSSKSRAAAALRSAKIAPQATLKVYAGAPHGLPTTHQDQFNADLLSFIQS